MQRSTSESESSPPRQAASRSSARHEALLQALGAAVRAARAAAGLTRRELAARAGLSGRFIAQLETGRGNISVGNLAAVAAALEVPPAALLEAEPPEAGGEQDEARRMRAEVAALLEREPPERLRALLASLREGQAAAPPPVIAMVGLRGAGKSTVGPMLARALGLPFVELDDRIQDATGLAVGEIFELHGEEYYRLAERRALEALVEAGRPLVVAVSGGIVTEAHSFRLLSERTLLVWLKASPRLHMERVRSQGDRRPMRDRPDAMAELRELLESRAALYAHARLEVDTSELPPRACAAWLAGQIGRMGADAPPRAVPPRHRGRGPR